MKVPTRFRDEPFCLTVEDIVRHARSLGILCQGRGSSANSAVCYALGITSVNLEESRLLMVRFLSEERNEPPDIDVDFEHERREEVLQYVYNKYGRERTALWDNDDLGEMKLLKVEGVAYVRIRTKNR